MLLFISPSANESADAVFASVIFCIGAKTVISPLVALLVDSLRIAVAFNLIVPTLPGVTATVELFLFTL